MYRATPALGCGIAAAMFVLSGQAAVTAASGCFGAAARAAARVVGAHAGQQRRRSVAAWLSVISWYVLILDLLPQHPHARGGDDHCRRRCRVLVAMIPVRRVAERGREEGSRRPRWAGEAGEAGAAAATAATCTAAPSSGAAVLGGVRRVARRLRLRDRRLRLRRGGW